VETLQQVHMLTAMNCDSLQGYYFSLPVVADAVPALLQRRWNLHDQVAARTGAPALAAPQTATDTH